MTAVLLVGLTAYRIWRLLALDELTAFLRDRLPWRLSGWLRCPWCSTVWYAAGVTALWDSVATVAAPVLVGAGGATVAAWIAVADRQLHDEAGS